MPDTILPSTTQEGAELAEQGADTGQRQGKSSIQKLKEKLQGALEAGQYWKERADERDSLLADLRSDIEQLKRQRDPRGPDDYSISEFLNAAYDPNTDQPTAMKALMHAVDKRLGELEKTFQSKVSDSLENRFRKESLNATFQNELGTLKARLGDELAPGTALWDTAGRYFNRLKEQLSGGNGSLGEGVENILRLRSIEMAARDLGIDRRRQQEEPARAPAPDEQLEGTSDAASEAQSSNQRFDDLLKTGNWQEAMKERMRRDYG